MSLERDKYRFEPLRYSFQSGVGTGRWRDLFPSDFILQVPSLYDFPRTDAMDTNIYFNQETEETEDTEGLPPSGSADCRFLRF